MTLIPVNQAQECCSLKEHTVLPNKKEALSRVASGQGTQVSHEVRRQNTALGSQAANEARIRGLVEQMGEAAKANDLIRYKALQAELAQAKTLRSADLMQHLDAQHLAAVECAAKLGNHRLRCVPSVWFETDTGRPVAWCTSRPIALEADARRAA
jgi:hypothetical protein